MSRAPRCCETWHATMRAFAEVDDSPLGATPARWAFGDAVVHEADLRGATTTGRVPETAVELGLQGALARWQQVLRRAGLGGVRVVLPDGRELWTGAPDDEIEVEVGADRVRGVPWARGPAQRRAGGRVVVVGGPEPVPGRRTSVPVLVGPDPDRRLNPPGTGPAAGRGGPPRGCPRASHVPQCGPHAGTQLPSRDSGTRNVGTRPQPERVLYDLPNRGVFSISGPIRTAIATQQGEVT